MKQTKRFLVPVCALALALVACAPTPTREGTGEFVDDAVITTKVKAALVDDPVTKAREISVKTFKGDVQLSGFVSSQTEADRAVVVARAVKGVKAVENDMRVK